MDTQYLPFIIHLVVEGIYQISQFWFAKVRYMFPWPWCAVLSCSYKVVQRWKGSKIIDRMLRLGTGTSLAVISLPTPQNDDEDNNPCNYIAVFNIYPLLLGPRQDASSYWEPWLHSGWSCIQVALVHPPFATPSSADIEESTALPWTCLPSF